MYWYIYVNLWKWLLFFFTVLINICFIFWLMKDKLPPPISIAWFDFDIKFWNFFMWIKSIFIDLFIFKKYLIWRSILPPTFPPAKSLDEIFIYINFLKVFILGIEIKIYGPSITSNSFPPSIFSISLGI